MNFDPKMTKNEHVKQAKDGLDVLADIHRYAKEGFAAIDPDDFARMRWFGIYQQKPNEGHFMWRIRISGGRVKPAQLHEIAKLSEEYGRGFGDVTTRQCIQLHWLTIENFPDALERMNKAGLWTQFACGDTPRNVCSCPMAGLLKHEYVDVGNLPWSLAEMFKAEGKSLSNLPRKFKTTIAGCPLHCNQPQINDIGAFGVRRVKDGVEQRGLGILVGGGLSSTPHFGQSLRVFVPEAKMAEQIPAIWKGMCELFRDSDELRFKRIRARLKFLVADKGWEWIRAELEKRIGFTLEHDENVVYPRGALHTDHVGIGEQKNGRFYVGIPIERGRWTSDQMHAVATLTERFGTADASEIRLSQKQNVIITDVPKANVDALVAELKNVGLDPHAPLWRQNLISCTGTQFCNLAVVETKQRAFELLKYLEEKTQIDSPIMLSVSGCPNSCAQYQVADIGLTGTKGQWQGEKVDAYDLCVGGRFGDQPEFVRPLFEKVPSPIIHRQIEQVVNSYLANRVTPDGDDDPEPFRDFIDRVEIEQLRKWSAIPEWTPPPKKEKRVPAPAGGTAAASPPVVTQKGDTAVAASGAKSVEPA